MAKIFGRDNPNPVSSNKRRKPSYKDYKWVGEGVQTRQFRKSGADPNFKKPAGPSKAAPASSRSSTPYTPPSQRTKPKARPAKSAPTAKAVVTPKVRTTKLARVNDPVVRGAENAIARSAGAGGPSKRPTRNSSTKISYGPSKRPVQKGMPDANALQLAVRLGKNRDSGAKKRARLEKSRRDRRKSAEAARNIRNIVERTKK